VERCVHLTGENESETESEGKSEIRQTESNTSVVWVVVLLLSFGVTMALVAMFFCWCCHWQRRRPLRCCDVMIRRDVTHSAGSRRALLQSLVGPPLRKRILFMRSNILYASSTVSTEAKVCPAAGQSASVLYIYLSSLVQGQGRIRNLWPLR